MLSCEAGKGEEPAYLGGLHHCLLCHPVISLNIQCVKCQQSQTGARISVALATAHGPTGVLPSVFRTCWCAEPLLGAVWEWGAWQTLTAQRIHSCSDRNKTAAHKTEMIMLDIARFLAVNSCCPITVILGKCGSVHSSG